MKKINALMIICISFLLLNCRTEDLSQNDNFTNSSSQSSKFNSRKIFPSEFQKIIGLNEKFGKSENLLNGKMSTGKNILENAVIDSSFAMETTNGALTSYTFPVYRNNQNKFFENLVILQNSNHQFNTYLYRYPKTGTNTFDEKNIEVYNLTNTKSSNSSKVIISTTITQNGCTQVSVNYVNCNEGGNHTNGQYCSALGIYMPYSTVTTTDTCNGEFGNNGQGGGGSGNVPYIIPTTPVFIYPKWGNCSERTGAHWDALNLNSSQLAFINSTSQDILRGHLTDFLVNNEVFTFDCNSSRDVSPDVKSVGLWILNFAMTNPEFLQSEYWTNFVNSDLRLQQGAINFLYQNHLSWKSFEEMFFLADKFLKENPDTENVDQIFNRLKSLEDALLLNPNLLLDIPCGELSKWQELAIHPIPQSVKNKIFQVNNLTGWFKEAVIQNLDYSNSYTVNMDVYPVRISNMPEKSPGIKYTHSEFFDYFRKNINNFTDINHGKFYPVIAPEYNIDDTQLWNSNNPLGSLITIKIPADNGTVICSGWGSQAWIFTTVKSPWDGEHPVSGNRLFGYFIDSSGDMVIYTRGVDRFTTKFSNNAIQYTAESFGYSEAKKMWQNMQEKVSSFVNNKNGNSSIITGTDYTPNFIFVKDYLKGKKPITTLGCH